MRNVIRVGATLLFAFSPIAAAAQPTSTSTAYQYDVMNGTIPCYVSTPQQYGSTSASCNSLVTGGSSYGRSASYDFNRSISSATSLNVYSANNSSGYAQAWSDQFDAIAVNGTSGAGNNLVFHFQTTQSSGFYATNGSGSMQNYYRLFMYGSDVGASAFVDGYAYDDGSTAGNSSNSAQTANGYDLTLGFNSFTGSYNFYFEALVYTYLANANQPAGAYGQSILYARLLGIDAVDAQGTVLASAYIDEDGVTRIDLVATPEPASLTLMASGLLSVVGMALRRRRRS